MFHKIKVLLKALKLKNTIKRIRYRKYLWKRYLGLEPAKLNYYFGNAVSVARPYEHKVVHFDFIYSTRVMFDSTPNGRFQSDENFQNLTVPPEDRHLPMRNPFAKEEAEELRTLGRILTFEERKQKSFQKAMDQVEEEYFRTFS